MTKSPLLKAAVVAGAVLSGSALGWLVLVCPRPRDAFGRELVLLAILAASGGFLMCWAAIVGQLSRMRLWSPSWTFLVGALPFWILGGWSLFIGRWAMGTIGFTREVLMVAFGSAAGASARKRAYPEMSDKDSIHAAPPPPTLFPK